MKVKLAEHLVKPVLTVPPGIAMPRKRCGDVDIHPPHFHTYVPDAMDVTIRAYCDGELR